MIIIEVLKDDSNELHSDLACLKDNGATIIYSKGIEGAQETVQILIEVAKIAIPSILAFIVARIESKRYITIKHDGMEISGLTKDNAMDVLTQMLESESEKANVLKVEAEASKTKAEAEKIKAEAGKTKAETAKIRAEIKKEENKASSDATQISHE